MFSFTTILQYHQQLQAGALTCLQAVRHYLQAIKAHQHLNAFIEVYADEALSRAASLDAAAAEGRPMGRLHGVVVGIKDVLCYAGHGAAASSRMLTGYESLYTATSVQRLIDEGAIIIGRQNCDEFGMGSTNENSVYGPVLNPVDQDYVPGGSSGGSAAAVAAGLCMVSLGTDTGGSVRLPADFCGIVGVKPTYGRVSRHGLIAYASSFDQVGVLAQNVADASLVLEIMAGADGRDGTALAQPVPEISAGLDGAKKAYRIAYFPEWVDHPSVDPQISRSLKDLLAQLQAEGHTVEPVQFSLTEYIVPTYYVLTTAEASSNLSRFDGVRYGYQSRTEATDLRQFYRRNRSEGFGPEVKRRIMLGTFVLSTGYFDAYFTKAQQVRRLLQQQTDAIFNQYDLIVAPTSPTPAYRAGEKTADPVAMYMGDIFTVFANLAGVPATSVPLFKHSSNLPFGVQVLAKRFNELTLLRFSQQLEALKQGI
ncbi:Asp-tRNA(Asn)/Glu-tRNA(Gln) amidotransferase subunit GatA [Paracnuella aquatica]|uniref:Asp-tRNA(Asn)/Glu-tRNA(Gln) amidotransferase subunit GatA n=1 Tax=Paracnuella aquatica TaxID=2268757 RepID=UPI000DEEDE61|nr:Asp-tRNA(Asn)/Glu-tRNA(Gln) amidotransferase subunit GatA [Paracnuella aquatica]RPD47489.1 Asp-tRNA(Asn)/Glu-tRNA(Gln) amidotransferase subunit GatA [Paracnuella aquatica]